MTYQPRIVDQELRELLASAGAVVIEGPKASGKTATARQVAASEVLLDVDDQARAAAEVSPGLILDGPAPRLIDEWQLVPAVWNHVRRAVDDRGGTGHFILAGSAVPTDDQTRHSGAGRMSRLQMRPMTLFESGLSAGALSLQQLMGGEAAGAADPGVGFRDLVDAICRGGWPQLRAVPVERAQRAVSAYLDEVRRTDIYRVDGVRRDPAKVGRLLRSLARNVATPAAMTTLAADLDGADRTLDRATISDYLGALTRLFVIEDQPAWRPDLRSRYRLRMAAKRHFVDPSLAVAALGASPRVLERDLNLLGFLFESLVIRDLRVYAQRLDGAVLHYRDDRDLEVDAVIELADGRWMGVEVKLGGEKAIDQAAAGLLQFSRRIDTSKCGPPACLAVIVASGYGYRRPDGVSVLPLGALGP